MATLTRSAISAAMSLILMDQIVHQSRRDVPLLHLLDIETSSNDTLTWKAKFDTRTAGGAYAEGADMSDSDYDSNARDRASLNWAQYRAGVKVSGLAQALSVGGNYVGGDVFNEELEDATDKIANDLGADFYGGNPAASPTELAGAAIAIDSDTGSSFANLDPATYSGWVAGENTIATADLSFKNLREKLHRPIKDATGRDPDFVTCPGTQWDAVKALFDDKADVVQEISVRGQLINIKQAFGGQAIMVDGVPYIEDRHCTASTFYAWTAREVKVVQVPASPPAADPKEVVQAVKQLTGMDVTVSDVEQGLRAMKQGGMLTPTIEMLAQTGDAYKAQIKVYCQVKWRRRNAFAKLVLS